MKKTKKMGLVAMAVAVMLGAGNAPGATARVDDGYGQGTSFSPLGLGLIPPVQFPSVEQDIVGFRLNLLMGENRDVSFLDIGAVANVVDGYLYGVQVAGIANKVYASEGSVQIAGCLNFVERGFAGIQISGLANYAASDMNGFAIGCVNYVGGDFQGAQLGVLNLVGEAEGLQIGAFNYAKSLKGLQLGVFNVIQNSPVPFLPVANCSF